MASADAVRRARLGGQGLADGRSEPGGAAGVAGRVVGIQAQDLTAAALSLRARRPALVAGDVERALADGSLVLTWSLRGTRHVHAAADVRWLVGLLGPVFGRPGRRARQLGIDGEVGDRAVRVVRRALASGPLDRGAVAERLARHGVDPSGQGPIHVLRRAACEGILCIVPEPGGGERYVLLDDWVPAAGGPQDADAAAELARRYLSAFGPATPDDLAAWSGLPKRQVRAAWDAIAPELVDIPGPAGPVWLRGEDVDRLVAGAGDAAPVRMLGGFDTLLLGYADRSLHLPNEHRRRVNTGGGLVRPVVLDDGLAVATWALRRRRRQAPRSAGDAAARPGIGDVDVRVEVTPFPGARPRLEEEVAAIGRFLGLLGPPPVMVGEAHG